ncbi:MAG: hypothetical protein ACRC2B_07255, partial [Rubrivivax sp.]
GGTLRLECVAGRQDARLDDGHGFLIERCFKIITVLARNVKPRDPNRPLAFWYLPRHCTQTLTQGGCGQIMNHAH